MSGHRKKVTKQGRLTGWRPQREGLVRTQKESDQARHSQTGDHRGRDLSEHRKKVTKQGRLTFWRPQREGLVRIQKESK